MKWVQMLGYQTMLKLFTKRRLCIGNAPIMGGPKVGICARTLAILRPIVIILSHYKQISGRQLHYVTTAAFANSFHVLSHHRTTIRH